MGWYILVKPLPLAEPDYHFYLGPFPTEKEAQDYLKRGHPGRWDRVVWRDLPE